MFKPCSFHETISDMANRKQSTNLTNKQNNLCGCYTEGFKYNEHGSKLFKLSRRKREKMWQTAELWEEDFIETQTIPSHSKAVSANAKKKKKKIESIKILANIFMELPQKLQFLHYFPHTFSFFFH